MKNISYADIARNTEAGIRQVPEQDNEAGKQEVDVTALMDMLDKNRKDNGEHNIVHIRGKDMTSDAAYEKIQWYAPEPNRGNRRRNRGLQRRMATIAIFILAVTTMGALIYFIDRQAKSLVAVEGNEISGEAGFVDEKSQDVQETAEPAGSHDGFSKDDEEFLLDIISK